MQIYNLPWTALPIGVFFILKKYYLHSGELWLLLYANFLIISTFFAGWFTQTVHLIIITAMSVHVLLISKQTNGALSQQKYNIWVRILLHLEEEFSIFVYMIAAWLTLRVYTDKTSSFGIGTQLEDGSIFLGLDRTLGGWNCTQLEFVFIPCIWVILNSISCFLAVSIIKVEKDKDHLYKEYVLKYIVLPYLIFSLATFLYNLYSYKYSGSILQCYEFWKYSYFMKLAQYYGFALSTFYFFYAKKGVFLIEGQQSSDDQEEK